MHRTIKHSYITVCIILYQFLGTDHHFTKPNVTLYIYPTAVPPGSSEDITPSLSPTSSRDITPLLFIFRLQQWGEGGL